MSRIFSNCYQTYCNLIKAKSGSDTELMLSTLMALLIEQSKEIERRNIIKRSNL